MRILSIDHVQLAMPMGEEAKARAFYSGVLGMAELQKPVELAKRGGAWFWASEVQIHLGVEKNFRPAKKAHVALRAINCPALRNCLSAAGYPLEDDNAFPDTKRFYTEDCFGNRIEIICQD